MRTLYQAIERDGGKAAPALLKHLPEVGITDWGDLTKLHLNELRDHLTTSVCASSAKTYMAVLKAILGRYEDEGVIPCKEYRDILKGKDERPIKVAVSQKELALFEAVRTKNEAEEYVKACFLVGARTGMRHSDILRVSTDNITNGYLTYASQKTGIVASIPCSERTIGLIQYIRANEMDMPLMTFNRTVRRLAKRSGITERVKVKKGGKELSGEKWEFLSSHSARISFCTDLAELGLPLVEISRLAGHTNASMTEQRYIVQHKVRLSDKQLQFFG